MASENATQTVIANIFVRTSQKTNKPYYSLSIVADDDEFMNVGFIKPLRSAKQILEEASAKGLMTEGESKAGAYKMLTVVISTNDIVQVKDRTYLTNIIDFC